MLLDIPFVCSEKVADPQRYEITTAKLHRADGFAGWLSIVGPGTEELELGKRYVLKAVDGFESSVSS